MNILFIDDNRIEQMKLKRTMYNLGLSEPRLKIVGSAKEGFEVLASGTFRPHIILLDLNMPGTCGLEFLKQIKAKHEYSHIPIIVFSTSNHSNEIRQCYQNGVAAYLVKPLDYKTCKDYLMKLLAFWSLNEFAVSQC